MLKKSRKDVLLLGALYFCCTNALLDLTGHCPGKVYICHLVCQLSLPSPPQIYALS